jgi:hypothetical protein
MNKRKLKQKKVNKNILLKGARKKRKPQKKRIQ